MEARASHVLVGRARELDVLEQALDAAGAGSGSTVLVAGEAGIGKTRLSSELARRARDGGFDVLLGRSIDLVGTELPYQPFIEALHPLGAPLQVRTARSQLEVFEKTLASLTEHAESRPILLVLEDLHWADVSTLDLVVFLTHNLADRAVLVIGTYRADEVSSAERVRRLADGVRRSGLGLTLELGALEDAELAELVTTHARAPLPAALTNAIVARSEGNPFFAEELVAAASEQGGELPPRLRDLLLQRVARLDRSTQDLLRVAATAGRDVGYAQLSAVADLPKHEIGESLRRAVEQGVLVVEPDTSSFRFRHALLAEAMYGTILPGEREELHARLAAELARSGTARPAELAPHWAAAGRATEALAASVAAAREAEHVFAAAEAFSHVERALKLWDSVPGAAGRAGLDLAGASAWAAELASRAGAAPRAVELAQAAIALAGESDPLRLARLYGSLGRYLHETGRTDEALSAYERVVEHVPPEPPSTERAAALAGLATGLMLAWRFDDSMTVADEALTLARAVGPRATEIHTLAVLGRDLAYLGRAEEGVARLREALELAEAIRDPLVLLETYTSLTDVLTMLGRPTESAQTGLRGLEAIGRYGIDRTVLVANYVEALLVSGEWHDAARTCAAATRAIASNYPYMLLMNQADIEIGRGLFDSARANLEAALTTLREDRGQGIYDVYVAELALWEHRWTDAHDSSRAALAGARSRQAGQLRVWFCAKGLRALAELAALARARRDDSAVRTWLARGQELVAVARDAASESAAVTPNSLGWLALGEAEYGRARGAADAESWSAAAATWDELERPALAAYCRWRQVEMLVTAGASRNESSTPLRDAHSVATRLGAAPLLRELELLAERARLDLTPTESRKPDAESLEAILGLTPREAEVLTLVARGNTNREIAAELVISVKTASVHVSHILRKLGAPNRREAAAIAHRVAPPPARSELDA